MNSNFFKCSIFLFFSLTVNAQVNIREIAVANHPRTNQEIIAKVYEFDENINELHIDSLSNAAVVQLRQLSKKRKKPAKTGTLIFLNLENDSVIWQKPVDYQQEQIYSVGSNIYKLKKQSKRNLILNNKTGIADRELAHQIHYINKENIGFGYSKLFNENPNMMCGVDMNSYETLWEREVDRGYGISEFIELNDSILLISAGGIHAINIHNGKGWNELAITGELRRDFSSYKDGVMIFGVIGLVVASTLEAGAEPVMMTYLNKAESPILVEETGVYQATRDFVYKKDYNIGRTLWKQSIPEGFGSQSQIGERNGILYVVNLGKAQRGSRAVSYGKPSVFAFNSIDGSEFFNPVLPLDDGDKFNDILFGDSVIYAATNSQVISLSYEDGSVLDTFLVAHPNEMAQFKFLQEEIYVKQSDSIFYSPLKDTANLFCLKSNSRVYLIGTDRSVLIRGLGNQIWNAVKTIDNNVIISKENQLLIIDDKGKLLANFDVNTQLLKERLYYTQKNQLFEVDLHQFR